MAHEHTFGSTRRDRAGSDDGPGTLGVAHQRGVVVDTGERGVVRQEFDRSIPDVIGTTTVMGEDGDLLHQTETDRVRPTEIGRASCRERV